MKKFVVVNADDLGMSNTRNQAILDGYNNGFLTSTSVCANGDEFESAVKDIVPICPNLGIGIHLNIIEGRSLTNSPQLTDKNGFFNRSFFVMLIRSFRADFLQAVEDEFSAQIEYGQKFLTFDHLDSHVHTHAIPRIFKIAVKLASKYNIPSVRTQHEKLYFVPRLKQYLTIKYPINLIKLALLNMLTMINKRHLAQTKTNNAVIGVGYTGMMNSETIKYGLQTAQGEICECIVHPEPNNNEYLAVVDRTLKEEIERLGFTITAFGNIR
ncbi:hypothetical protein FACS1894103_5550 [Campylobacterota bacterium]|nr:hypothetical protein FACS1894103_5550 [Campylobacterota bacterium]